MEDPHWTIAYRKPRANRIQRAAHWAGTWQAAVDLAGKFGAEHPDLQVFYVATREAELSGYVPAEDVGNVLTATGRRVRITDDGPCVVCRCLQSKHTGARRPNVPYCLNHQRECPLVRTCEPSQETLTGMQARMQAGEDARRVHQNRRR